jgi:hypothetical protein
MLYMGLRIYSNLRRGLTPYHWRGELGEDLINNNEGDP